MFLVISISFLILRNCSYHGDISYFTLEWPINGLIVVFIVQTLVTKDLHDANLSPLYIGIMMLWWSFSFV